MNSKETASSFNPKSHLLFFIVLVLIFSVASVFAQTVVLEPTKDNSMYEESNNSNGSGNFLFIGRTSGNAGNSLRRALVHFDIAGSIPAGATITAVSLTMTMDRTVSGNAAATLHVITKNWGEGTSNAPGAEGAGTGATTGDATWSNAMHPGTAWMTQGGDFTATASGTVNINGTGNYTWNSTTTMVANVQSWLDNSGNNFGWIIRGGESGGTSAKRFISKDNPSTGSRPQLSVTYTAVCTNPDVPTLSGGSTICPGVSVNLSVSSGNLNDATSWQWYSGSCGGTAVGSGVSINVSPNVSTTYFVRGEGGCVTPGNCANVIVTVQDNQDPTITCPGNQNETLNANCQFTLPDYTGLATVSDNCTANPTVSQSPIAGTSISVNTQITLTVDDGNGNTAMCTFMVELFDTTDPVITCPSDQQALLDPACRVVLPNYATLATASDNCTANPVIVQSPPPSTNITSSTLITLTAFDAAGNSASCTFMAIVSDGQVPSITCPGDQMEIFDSNCQLSLPDYTGMATSSDNCTSNPVISQDPVPGTIISGNTLVTLTAIDQAGNKNTCQFNVNPVDNEMPSITCPADQVESLTVNCIFSLPDYSTLATTSDNCSANITITQIPAIGTNINSDTQITLTARDESGNQNSCSFMVQLVDNNQLSISCPATKNEFLNVSCEFVLPDYRGEASVTNNCTGSSTISQSPSPGITLSSDTTIWLFVTDGMGAEDSCSFELILTDTISPIINCPGDQNEVFDSNCQLLVPDYSSLVTSSDNCTGALSITQNPMTGSMITGNTVVIMTATDQAGNSSSCQFNIIPSDNIQPDITCPSDQVGHLVENCAFELIDYTSLAITSDNCSGSISLIQSPLPGVLITANAMVTLIADDGNGNTNSCSFMVILTDTISPQINCPADQSELFDASCSFLIPDYTALAASSDNCTANSTITQSPVQGTDINGRTTITLIATDDNGNQAECQFDVIPVDNVNPDIVCPEDQIGQLDADCQFELIDYRNMATSSDNCSGNLTVTQSPDVGTIINADTEITLVVTDESGNQNNCVFNVLLVDLLEPQIICLEDIVTCDAIVNDISPLMASDNCIVVDTMFVLEGATEMSGSGDASGVQFSLGITTVKYIIEDSSGNQDSCSFEVLYQESLNIEINQDQDTLRATELTASYQWLDCATNMEITGATGPNFVPEASGLYAVIVELGTCIDTSACFDFIRTNVVLTDFENEISAFPNPANDIFKILFGRNQTDLELKLYRINGQLINEIRYKGVAEISLNTTALELGVYFVEILSSDNRAVLKMIRN